jgi:hypothetical protein
MPPIFYIPTAIVVGLICSYIGTLHCHLQIKNFTKTLEPLELSQYQNTRQRRLYYFITGFVIAIIGSILFLCLHKSNMYHRISNALVILLLTPMIVYTLFPKSPYLLEQSTINNQETQDWFKIYVCMKNGMIYGFCVGFIAALIILAILQLVYKSTKH